MAKGKARGFFEPPSRKAKRYAGELKRGKNSLTGEDLNGKTASYRMGYLNSRKQASKARQAYVRKHRKGSKPASRDRFSPEERKKVMERYRQKRQAELERYKNDAEARERYMKVMAEDFPKDFIRDDEWDYVDAMASWPKHGGR